MDTQGLVSPAAVFEKMQGLLKAKDDTSRFVGLALLKTVLDNGQLVQDPGLIRTLWESLSPKFLDRLLAAKQNEKVNKADAKDMVSLAVAVLHTFTNLLPDESRKEKRLTARTAPLVKALIQSPPETTTLILQTLLMISSQVEGALEILSVPDLSPVIEIANQFPLVLEIFQYTWLNASTSRADVASGKTAINQTILALINVFKGTDAVTLLAFMGNLLPKLQSEVIPISPSWLPTIVSMLRALVSSKPTATGRAAYTQLGSALLQLYPATCPALLFKDVSSTNPDSKPFSYLFVNLLLIDLRTSFPSLLEKLNTAEYPAISLRLASAFDILSSFIGFLVRSLEEEVNTTGFFMPPDLLLKLRKDIAETISLTIEYLRDRWDASVAGASGLHHDARAGTAVTSSGKRLTLTWEAAQESANINSDPLILAGIRALAIWIREDENKNLRKESAGLMDMWVELYKSNSESKSNLESRYPILLALEGVMVTEHGIECFLAQDGWAIVSKDLESIVRITSKKHNSVLIETIMAEASRGLQIIRVLLAVLDHEVVSIPEESWMSLIPIATAMNVSSSSSSQPLVLEFQLGMLQLSMALLGKASGGLIKRHITSHAALGGIARQLERRVRELDDETERDELSSALEDVELELGNLRL